MHARPGKLSVKVPASHCVILLTNDNVSITPPAEVKRVDVSKQSTDLAVGSHKSCLASRRSSVDCSLITRGAIPLLEVSSLQNTK